MNFSDNSTEKILFPLTQSPYVNELIKAAQRLCEEKDSHNEQEFEEKIGHMIGFIDQLHNVFLIGQETQEITDEINMQNEIIEQNVALFKEGLGELSLYFEDDDLKHIADGVADVKEATDKLFETFAVLQEEEAKGEIYSKSPYINDLLKITYGVIKGKFEPEHLKSDLEWLLGLWEKSFEEFSILKKSSAQSEEINERLVLVEDAYVEYSDGLKEMLLYLEDGNTKHLELGSDMVMVSSEYLINSQEFLRKFSGQTAEEVKSETCLYCGAEIIPGDKVCVNGHILLTDMAQQELIEAGSGSMSIHLGDEVKFGSEERVITLNVKKVIDDVESFKSKELTSEGLAKTINWFAEKISAGKKQYSLLKSNEKYKTDEQKELIEKSSDLLEAGISYAERGIVELRMYFEDTNTEHFAKGIDLIIEASDSIYRLQKLYEGQQKKAEVQSAT